MQDKVLKIFVCENFEVENKEKKEFPELIVSPYVSKEMIFSNLLESLFADVNCYAIPPTFLNNLKITKNQYVI